MIRDVDLVSYLPPFIADYQETRATLEAENPEFVLVWNAADQTLKNEFIETADEYGISRFEKILGILPSKEDTLESRRARVYARWFNAIPYTWRAFLERLISLCGESNFTITKNFMYYRIDLEVNLELFGQVEELEYMIETMTPCNMVFVATNKIPCETDGFALVAGGIAVVENFFITNDFKSENTISGKAAFGGGIVEAAGHFVTNDSKEDVAVNGNAFMGGGAVNTASVIITNDFNETFNITGEAISGSGVVFGEVVGITNE